VKQATWAEEQKMAVVELAMGCCCDTAEAWRAPLGAHCKFESNFSLLPAACCSI